MNFLIRADASAAIGTGHVMRCLALTQACQDEGGAATFAMSEVPAAIEQRLVSEGFEIAHIAATPGSLDDAKATVELARKVRTSWLVIDGDRFDVSFLNHVKSCGVRTLLIDDFAKRDRFSADTILNPNIGASEASYGRDSCTTRTATLLLGESYIPLRREFLLCQGSRSFPDRAHKILVTFGGSDPEDLTRQVIAALAPLTGYEMTVVAGPACASPQEESALRSSHVRVLSNPANMPELMADSDIAIVAAGGTLWELLYMGCAVLSYSRNPIQARVVEELSEKGIIRNLHATRNSDGGRLPAEVEAVAASKELRQRMATTGRRVVDGRGARRVLQALREHGERR